MSVHRTAFQQYVELSIAIDARHYILFIRCAKEFCATSHTLNSRSMMHSVRIHKVITLLVSLLYRMGIWHRGDKPTPNEKRLKIFYCLYHPLYALSLGTGAITSEKQGESIFLLETTIGAAVVRLCVFTIRYDDDHSRFTDKLRGFMKFALVFIGGISTATLLATFGLTFLGSERSIFLKIAFPLDYENSEVGFWLAFVFLSTILPLSSATIIFVIVIWYLLLMCSVRYEILGGELRNLGRNSDKANGKMTERQRHDAFSADLKASITAHLHLRGLVDDVGSCFSNLFLLQFATSGVCICGSIYCLAFDVGETLEERIFYFLMLFYFLADLFMITYFGNEITLAIDRLSYSLFESDWYNQPVSTQKDIITFGEYLKQPHELMIGKLYPLTLETFTRILNSAHSMFNILKSFQ